MMKDLAYAMEDRGDDSWGVAIGQGSEVIVKKDVGPISGGWVDCRPVLGWDSAIWHTRRASVGKVCRRNAHPFMAGENGKICVGVHNGGVSNWELLNKKYNRHVEVDSEHIWMHVAEGKDTIDINGSGALAWFEKSDGELRLFLAYFNSGSLHVAEVDGAIVFASTEEAIRRAARFARVEIDKWWKLKAEYKYEITREIREIAEMGFGFAGGYQQYQGRYVGGLNTPEQGRGLETRWRSVLTNQNTTNQNTCLGLRGQGVSIVCGRGVNGKEVLCVSCLPELIRRLDAKTEGLARGTDFSGAKRDPDPLRSGAEGRSGYFACDA